MKTLLHSLVILSVILMTGCETSYVANNKKFCLDDKGLYFECGEVSARMMSMSGQAPEPSSNSNAFIPNENFVLLKDYAEQIAHQLYQTMQGRTEIYPMVVTSFVNYDASLNQSSVLGNQLSELLIHELQRLGLPVVEHKLTGNIEVTAEGDFVLSRDISKLQREQNIGAVVTGTLITSRRGIVINSRIVQIDNNQLIGSASKVIPHWIMEQLG